QSVARGAQGGSGSMTAQRPEKEFDALRLEAEATMTQLNDLLLGWQGALKDRQFFIGRGDGVAAERSAQKAKEAREALINIAGQCSDSLPAIASVIERDFVRTRRWIERNVAPMRERISELRTELEELERRERELSDEIGYDVAQSDAAKTARDSWLSRFRGD